MGVPKRTTADVNGRGSREPGGWMRSVPTIPVGMIATPVVALEVPDTGVAGLQCSVP